MEKIIGFHATDRALADSIIANGFSFSRSEEHWLGNGVYFFADPDLAVWWGNNPTNTFGVKIEHPCNSSFSEIESENLLDMRRLKDYNYVAGGLITVSSTALTGKYSEPHSPKTNTSPIFAAPSSIGSTSTQTLMFSVAPFSNPRASFLEKRTIA